MTIKFKNDNQKPNAQNELQCFFVIYIVEGEDIDVNKDVCEKSFDNINGWYTITYPVIPENELDLKNKIVIYLSDGVNDKHALNMKKVKWLETGINKNYKI